MNLATSIEDGEGFRRCMVPNAITVGSAPVTCARDEISVDLVP